MTLKFIIESMIYYLTHKNHNTKYKDDKIYFKEGKEKT